MATAPARRPVPALASGSDSAIGAPSLKGEVWHQLRRDRLALAGLVVLALLLVTALLGKLLTEWVVLFDPTLVRLPEKLVRPLALARPELLPVDQLPLFGRYLLGTDELGRDVFARMLQGSFVSLSIGFVAVSIELGIGVTLGGLAGYYGGRVDALIMRFTDVMLCFPTFFLILTVVALLPPSIWNIMVVIGATSWMGTCRFVRAELMALREQDFVRAARALGLSDARVIFRHLIPNAIAPVLVSATIAVASAILTESGLSYLGFGVQPPNASWGNILSDGRTFLFDAPWLFVIPGGAILIVVLAFNLVGEGLRDALNPRLRRQP